jgi:hypothetical protein
LKAAHIRLLIAIECPAWKTDRSLAFRTVPDLLNRRERRAVDRVFHVDDQKLASPALHLAQAERLGTHHLHQIGRDEFRLARPWLQTDGEQAAFVIVQAALPPIAGGQFTNRDWIAGDHWRRF